uniref:DnaJ subfamily B member 4 n=1 Tax=Anthurium amnicola TaxID=1678845 RepID=A0A1D1YEH1_9ARAE
MGDPIDFYGVLNIPKDSTPEDIRKAYKALVRRWHPDKNPPSSKKEAEAKFKAITQAYEALSDKEYRSMFGVYHSVDGEGSAKHREGWASTRPSPAPSPRGADQGQHQGDGQVPKRANSDGYHQYYSNPAAGPARRKPPPVERKLECTLEELCRGCKKEIRFTRDVLDRNTGMVVRKEEVQTVRVKPGWKKGTKVTFENMGDERRGSLPADVVYTVSEKEHPFFKRVGNDLVLKVEVPLVSALTGWSFSFRLLGGEKMSCSFQDEVIHPGYEKVIQGEGMPLAKERGARGDLRIKFHIVFPKQLSEEQRSAIRHLFRDSS